MAIEPSKDYYRLMELAGILKALADSNRLRILTLLQNRTLCVCDLEEVLKLNQSNLSRHLAKLKQAGLVEAKKSGLFMYYSRRPLPPPYGPVVESLYETMAESPEWEDDRRALETSQGCS